MAKKNYEDLAKKVLELIGGEENVTFFTHCMTRLRFNVKDKGLVDTDALDNIDDFAGALWAGDQLQIIVGAAVNSVYDEILKNSQLSRTETIDENLDKKEKLTLKKIPSKIITTFSECMFPLVGYLIVIGMCSAIYSIIGPDLLNLVSKESNIYQLFYFIAQAGFYFMPIAVTISSSKKFGCNTMTVLLITCLMLYPDLMTLVGKGKFTCYGLPVTSVTYTGQVLPYILIAWIYSYVEKALNKYLPEFLKTLLVGTLSVLIVVPIALCVCAPIGYYIGEGFSWIIMSINSKFGVLANVLVGATWTLLVACGMHSTLGIIGITSLTTAGVDYIILPVVFASTFVQLAAPLAVFLKTKDKKLKDISIAALISTGIGGAIEPAIYTIYLKYKKVLFAVLAGHALSGLLIGIFHVGLHAFGASNILGILAFVPGGHNNLLYALIASIAGGILTFVLIFFFGYDKKVKE